MFYLLVFLLFYFIFSICVGYIASGPWIPNVLLFFCSSYVRLWTIVRQNALCGHLHGHGHGHGHHVAYHDDIITESVCASACSHRMEMEIVSFFFCWFLDFCSERKRSQKSKNLSFKSIGNNLELILAAKHELIEWFSRPKLLRSAIDFIQKSYGKNQSWQTITTMYYVFLLTCIWFWTLPREHCVVLLP